MIYDIYILLYTLYIYIAAYSKHRWGVTIKMEFLFIIILGVLRSLNRPRPWLKKLYKKMTKRDKRRIAKAQENRQQAMVIKTINKRTGKTSVFLDSMTNKLHV